MCKRVVNPPEMGYLRLWKIVAKRITSFRWTMKAVMVPAVL